MPGTILGIVLLATVRACRGLGRAPAVPPTADAPLPYLTRPGHRPLPHELSIQEICRTYADPFHTDGLQQGWATLGVQIMDGGFGRDDRWFVPHGSTLRNNRLLHHATFGMSLAILMLCVALLCGVALCSHSGVGQDEPVPALAVGP